MAIDLIGGASRIRVSLASSGERLWRQMAGIVVDVGGAKREDSVPRVQVEDASAPGVSRRSTALDFTRKFLVLEEVTANGLSA